MANAPIALTNPKTPMDWDSEKELLRKILNTAAGGLSLPPADYVAYTYVGSTNNIETATYKTGGSGGTTVATLTFTYVADGAADDDKIESIALT